MYYPIPNLSTIIIMYCPIPNLSTIIHYVLPNTQSIDHHPLCTHIPTTQYPIYQPSSIMCIYHTQSINHHPLCAYTIPNLSDIIHYVHMYLLANTQSINHHPLCTYYPIPNLSTIIHYVHVPYPIHHRLSGREGQLEHRRVVRFFLKTQTREFKGLLRISCFMLFCAYVCMMYMHVHKPCFLAFVLLRFVFFSSSSSPSLPPSPLPPSPLPFWT